MNQIILTCIFFLISFLLSEKKKNSYKNIYAAITSVVLCLCSFIAIAVITALGVTMAEPLIITAAVACCILVCQAIVKKISASDGYHPPYRYINGKLSGLLRHFYEKDQASFYLKPKYIFLRNSLFAAIIVETVFLVVTLLTNNVMTEPLLVCICSLLMVFLETALFLCGITKISVQQEKYKLLQNNYAESKLMRANYEYPDDYEYLFRKNNKTEKTHLIYSTIHNYRIPEEDSNYVRLYNFEEKKYTYIADYIQNDIIESFMESNGLPVNQLYVQVFSLLDKGNNVLMESSSYSDFDPYLAAMIKKVASETYKTVVVVDTESSGTGFIARYEKIFRTFFGVMPIPVIRRFKDVVAVEHKKMEKQVRKDTAINTLLKSMAEETPDDELKADIIVLTPEDILDSQNSDVLRKISSEISFIIYYDFSECVHEETLFCKIIHSILDADDKIRTLYMSDGFFDFKQAINNFFSVRPFYEVTVPRKVPVKSYCSVWKYENAKEFQERSIINPSVDFGMHPVLASLAKNYLHNNSMIIADENDIYHETFNEYANTTKNPEKIDCFVGWKDVVDGRYVYCSVTDRYNNIPHTYLALRGVGCDCEYINIVSKPYLLREYLSYFSKFFSTVPDALTSFSAAMINTDRATALECLIKSYLVGCTAEQLKNYAIKIDADSTLEPERLLKIMLAKVKFGCSDEDLVVTVEDERYFINQELYDCIIGKTGFVNKINFTVNNQQIERYQKDFNYLVPQQKIALDGRKYTVLDINGSSVELSDSIPREAVYSTRLVRSAQASSSIVRNTFSAGSNNNRASMQMFNIICNLDVKIHGRIAFKDDYSFDESRRMNNFTYTSVPEKSVRNYIDSNVLCVKLKVPNLVTASNKGSIAHTLALLINEMLPTFFPKHSERIMVSCTGWDDPIPDNAEEIDLDYIVAPLQIDNVEECADDEFCIYMYEDSFIETGVVNVFWQDEELRYMFNILEDYLYYLEVIDRETAMHIFGENTDKPLHELRKALLHLIDHPIENGYAEYANVIRRTRDTFGEKRLNNTFMPVCDFCGKPIEAPTSSPNYKYYHYSGKCSCLSCAKTAVSTLNFDQVEKGRVKIVEWMDKRYKTSPDGPSLCILEDAEFLNKYTHPEEYHATTDDHDTGVAGFTVMNDVKTSVNLGLDEEVMLRVISGYAGSKEHPRSDDCEDWVRLGYFVENANIIAVENGMPADMFEHVLAHELTHQWQYEHLDFHKVYLEPYPFTVKDAFDLSVDMTQFRLEGHASWVEWKYMIAHGNLREAAKFRRSMMNRNDEYGIGFRWFNFLMMVGGYDKYSKIKRGFIFKLKRLFYQIINNPHAMMELYFGKDTNGGKKSGKDKKENKNKKSKKDRKSKKNNNVPAIGPENSTDNGADIDNINDVNVPAADENLNPVDIADITDNGTDADIPVIDENIVPADTSDAADNDTDADIPAADENENPADASDISAPDSKGASDDNLSEFIDVPFEE